MVVLGGMNPVSGGRAWHGLPFLLLPSMSPEGRKRNESRLGFAERLEVATATPWTVRLWFD